MIEYGKVVGYEAEVSYTFQDGKKVSKDYMYIVWDNPMQTATSSGRKCEKLGCDIYTIAKYGIKVGDRVGIDFDRRKKPCYFEIKNEK